MRRRPPSTPLRITLVVALLFATGGFGGRANVAAAATPSPEAQFTAVFLYNFAQFVDWPADAFAAGNAPLEIGVVSPDPGVGDSLAAAVAGKSVGGHPLVVRRFPNPAAAAPCHLLYVEGAPPADVERLLQRLGKGAVLTVGNTGGFLDSGGVIRLFTEGNKMRFEVNLKAMQQAGLKISSQLLKMASNH
jgi:hypothetical protein